AGCGWRESGAPREMWCCALERRQRHRVVRGVPIAIPRAIPMLLGQPALERQNALGGPSRISLAHEGEKLRDVVGVRLANSRKLVVRPQIVIAVWHPEA